MGMGGVTASVAPEDFDPDPQPDEARGLGDYKADAARDFQWFENLHGKAFLVLKRAPQNRLNRPVLPQRTQTRRLADAGPRQELPPDRVLVFPIRKTERSLIDRFYSVGQTRNNDVTIRDVSVSKFHAFFQDGENGVGLTLQDSNSTNGTLIDGAAVPHQGEGDPMPVRSGALIRFGTVELTFLAARDFYNLVRTVFGVA